MPALQDWRRAAATDIAPLFAAETTRWRTRLQWDVRATLASVESARRNGTLPGFLIRDGRGAVHGWIYYLVHRGTLQIGGLAATTAAETEALLDAVLTSPAAARVSDAMLFAFADAPGLERALAARRFAVDRYRYLQRAISGVRFARVGNPWADGDCAAVASLMQSAYPTRQPARPFARAGDRMEWLEYVTQLVTTKGCGTFLPRCSIVVKDGGGKGLSAAAMVTEIAPRTAHLAQIAVDPRAQGRGLGRRLLESVLAAAQVAAQTRLTLLVSDSNEAARRLYASLWFEESGCFISAGWAQPRRSTSVAPERGGAMIFR